LKKSVKQEPAATAVTETPALAGKDLTPIFRDLEVVESSLHSSLKLRGYFENPNLGFEDKAATLRKIFKDYISPEAYDFVLLLIHSNAVYLLTDIIRRYRLHRTDTGVMELEIRTAIPLAPEEKEKLAERFAKKLGRHVTIRNVIDGSIVAGMIVKTGDMMIDASLQTKMRNLVNKLRTR
jgi:F-type H+-transporting ATPase subunit delta